MTGNPGEMVPGYGATDNEDMEKEMNKVLEKSKEAPKTPEIKILTKEEEDALEQKRKETLEEADKELKKFYDKAA